MLSPLLSTSIGYTDATPVSVGMLKRVIAELFGATAGDFPVSLTSTASAPVLFSGVVNKSFATLNSPTGGTPALKSFTLPGGALAATAPGSALRVRGWGTFANNGNAKTVLLKFGATTLVTVTATASAANAWYVDAIIVVRSATTQSAQAFARQGETTPTIYTVVSAPGETLSGDIAVAFTGTQTSAADIIQEGMLVEYVA